MSALLAMVVGLSAAGIVLAGLGDATAAESLAGFTFEPPTAAGWAGGRAEVPPGKLWLGNGTDFSYEKSGLEGATEFADARIIRFFQPHEPRPFLDAAKISIKAQYSMPPFNAPSVTISDDDSPGGPCLHYHFQSAIHQPPAADRTLVFEGWTCAHGSEAYIEMIAGIVAPTASAPASLPPAEAAFLHSLRVTAVGTP
jgi:hypothetical protein